MDKIYTSIRGTSDFDQQTTGVFNDITEQARRIFVLFGYSEIILPYLEEIGLFQRGVGEGTDIVERQMFKLEGKDIVLRPEGTAQVVRYYLENSLYKQSDFYKFSYIGAMFRGERPQKGRLRQFHHIGAEAFGSDSFYLDGEIICLTTKILEEIGIKKWELKINTLGCLNDKENFSRCLHKSLNSQKNKLCDDCQTRLNKSPLRILDCKKEGCKKTVASLNLNDAHLCEACKTQFKNLLSFLDDLGIKYIHSPFLVRGLDYYTNTVFEIISQSLGSQDAIGAGGRYNNLVQSLGGPPIPAIGFALGIERILLLLDKKEYSSKIKAFVTVTSESLEKEGFKIIQKLREKGIACDKDYCGKSLKSQLRQAQKKGINFVIIVGEEELKENCVTVKDMGKSSQQKVNIENVFDFLIRGEKPC